MLKGGNKNDKEKVYKLSKIKQFLLNMKDALLGTTIFSRRSQEGKKQFNVDFFVYQKFWFKKARMARIKIQFYKNFIFGIFSKLFFLYNVVLVLVFLAANIEPVVSNTTIIRDYFVMGNFQGYAWSWVVGLIELVLVSLSVLGAWLMRKNLILYEHFLSGLRRLLFIRKFGLQTRINEHYLPVTLEKKMHLYNFRNNKNFEMARCWRFLNGRCQQRLNFIFFYQPIYYTLQKTLLGDLTVKISPELRRNVFGFGVERKNYKASLLNSVIKENKAMFTLKKKRGRVSFKVFVRRVKKRKYKELLKDQTKTLNPAAYKPQMRRVIYDIMARRRQALEKLWKAATELDRQTTYESLIKESERSKKKGDQGFNVDGYLTLEYLYSLNEAGNITLDSYSENDYVDVEDLDEEDLLESKLFELHDLPVSIFSNRQKNSSAREAEKQFFKEKILKLEEDIELLIQPGDFDEFVYRDGTHSLSLEVDIQKEFATGKTGSRFKKGEELGISHMIKASLASFAFCIWYGMLFKCDIPKASEFDWTTFMLLLQYGDFLDYHTYVTLVLLFLHIWAFWVVQIVCFLTIKTCGISFIKVLKQHIAKVTTREWEREDLLRKELVDLRFDIEQNRIVKSLYDSRNARRFFKYKSKKKKFARNLANKQFWKDFKDITANDNK